MKKHLNFLFSGVAFALLFLTGCETFDDALKPEPTDAEKAKFVISINEVVEYPRARQLEREIETFNGRTIWINLNTFIHSRDIELVKLIPSKEKDGFFDLSLKLTRKGKVMWISLCEEVKTKKFGVIVDGTFYRMFQPEKLVSEDDEFVTLKGPFDPTTAKAIEKNAPLNYKKFNKDKI